MDSKRRRKDQKVYFQFETDILWEILLRLPMKALLACRCVCKTWCDVTKNPTFTDMQASISSKHPPWCFIYRPIHSLGSVTYEINELWLCNTSEEGDKRRKIKPFKENLIRNRKIVFSHNGLLCLAPANTGPSSIVICNPITNEWIELPQPNNIVKDSIYSDKAGFCFVPARDEHVALQLCTTWDRTRHCRVTNAYILTSGQRSWRLITLPSRISSSNCLIGKTVYWNNAFHWKVRMVDHDSDDVGILSFDTTQETFQVILYTSDRPSRWLDSNLHVSKGSLLWSQLHENVTKVWEVTGVRVGEFSIVYRGVHENDAREFSRLNGSENLHISLQAGLVVASNDMKQLKTYEIDGRLTDFAPVSYSPSLASVHSMGLLFDRDSRNDNM